ncbi:MAG TPA: hypothetical protein VJU61_12060, partial [Polyangiaceae bacterium]|nr:hypothetical protein [Polyangiaceae bacterium]
MKSCDPAASRRGLMCSVIGGLCAAWLGTACSEAHPADSLEQLQQGLRNGPPRHSRESGRSHWGHRRGHRGGSHSGGTPTPPVSCDLSQFIDQDRLFATISSDLARLDADDQPFARYLSVADRANACEGSLEGDRAALSKLVNSLSISATVTQPVAVDAAETLYRIDLRDYDWDREIVVNGIRFNDAWEAIIAESPYALPFVGDDADDASADTGTTVPVLFGSAFVAAAASAPLYYALIDVLPDLDDQLTDGLGIDVANARASGETVRAGFVADGLDGETQFLAERFFIEFRAGVAWQISEVGGDLFDDPLGTPQGERELVFTLPNGLQGHIVADANGRLRNDSGVLVDFLEADQGAKMASSFFRLRAQGVDVQDEVRPFVLANPRNFRRAERDAILAAFPPAAELEAALDADRSNFFAASLARLGLDIDDAPEPVSQTFANFSADVDLATAAGELMVTADDLRDNLSLLDPVLSVLERG